MARTKTEKTVKEEPLEKQLWKSADKLRKNIDAAEHKHVPANARWSYLLSQATQPNICELIVNLPDKLFLNTQIPACQWFMNRARDNGHPRKGKILFIDARNLGHLINRRTRELGEDMVKL